MKMKKLLPFIIILTFLIGLFFVLSANKFVSLFADNKSEQIEKAENSFVNETVEKESYTKPILSESEPIISYDEAKTYGGSNMLDEKYFLDLGLKYKYLLLESGGYHGDEVTAKSNETWLGMYSVHTKTYLKKDNIKVERVHDEIVDDSPKQKTGKKVSTSGKVTPLFLINGVRDFREGEIKTYFKGLTFDESAETDEDITEFRKNFIKTFDIGDEKYVLRVVKVYDKQGEKRFILLFESSDKKQILHISRENDYLGTLFWVGDFDRDNKPDLYLSPWIQENTSVNILFLSSKAKGNNLVKIAAILATSGC